MSSRRYIDGKNVQTKGTAEWITFDVTETIKDWLLHPGKRQSQANLAKSYKAAVTKRLCNKTFFTFMHFVL